MTAPSQLGLHVEGVSKSFASGDGKVTPALHDIHFNAAPGEFVTLLGPSGCGKTTLLRLLNGLIAPDKGTIKVLGDPPRPGRQMGFVFQSFRLIPWMNVHGNVAFGLQGSGLSRSEIDYRVREVLEMVGLSCFAAIYPRELSGGMKQRVALARAIAPRPRVLLMDEPFASLDAQTRELMQMELMYLHATLGSVVVFVTHSVDEAIVLSDRIVVLGPNPGRVVDEVKVTLSGPRWRSDLLADPEYVALRQKLSDRMHDLVINDPNSPFYGRTLRDLP